MKKFIEEYGFGILTAIVVIVLLCLATPVGDTIGNSLKGIVQNLSKQTTNLANDAWDRMDNNFVDDKIYWEVKDNVLYLSAKEELSGSFNPKEEFAYDTTSKTHIQPWVDNRGSITKVVIKDRIVPKYMTGWFDSFTAVTSYERLDLIDTQYCKSFYKLFNKNGLITSLDLSNWDTSNVTDMSYMFYGCSSFQSSDLSKWDTSNVTTMYVMFYNCENLTTIGDISNWNTSKVTDMSFMFSNCSSLQSLDLSNLNTSNVANMKAMFQTCTNLTEIKGLENWNVSNVTDMTAMFNKCSSLQSLDLSKWNVSSVTNMVNMFSACSSLQSLDLSKWNVSYVTTMEHMFTNLGRYANGPVVLNLSNWDVRNVANFNSIFDSCGRDSATSLQLIGVDKWNIAGATNVNDMFNNCGLNAEFSLDLSGWVVPESLPRDAEFAGNVQSKIVMPSNW